MDETKSFKRDCLIHEHDTLSRFVEQEVVATAMARVGAAVAWIIGMSMALSAELSGLEIAFIVFPGLAATWIVDVYFSYVGVVYKVRRLAVRKLLADLPSASAEAVAGWTTPVNPFDGGDKKGALLDSVKSPWVNAPYLVLEIATIVLLVIG